VEPGPVTVTWGYDNAYRLTGEQRENSGVFLYTDTFTYDSAGNRTIYESSDQGLTNYTYDVANQLETAVKGASRTTYTYDNNGNLEVENASGTRTTHTWDDANQLTQVAKTGMTTNQYTFNGDGQRVQIVDSEGTKKPIWDFVNVLLETDGSNVTQAIYTLEPVKYGNIISQRRGSTTSFYLFDALGSTRKLTGSAGSVTDSYDYRAYGETYASSVTTTNVFRWVGKFGYYLDIDRLAYYMRARFYNPAVARFLSQDPLGFVGSRSNLYEYVSCNVVNWHDPLGLATIRRLPPVIRRLPPVDDGSDPDGRKDEPPEGWIDKLPPNWRGWPGDEEETGGGWDELQDWGKNEIRKKIKEEFDKLRNKKPPELPPEGPPCPPFKIDPEIKPHWDPFDDPHKWEIKIEIWIIS
jgi:RHS repeat-associated protein